MTHALDGSINVTVVSGASYTGVYAADGSINVVKAPGNAYVGVYHPCGAFYVTPVTSGQASYYAADGSINVCESPYSVKGAVRVTAVSGSLATAPAWVLASYNISSGLPSLVEDFTTNLSWTPSGGQTTASSTLTCTRASVGYASDTTGAWTSFANNTPRITNQGLLVEEARTNSIRNNSMQGVVAGPLNTTGVLPTNWGVSYGTTGFTSANLTIGTPTTVNGVDVLPVTVSGTATGTSIIAFVIESTAASSNGQTWTGSVFEQFTGTFPRTTSIEIDELSNVSAFLAGGSASATPTGSLNRRTLSYTNTNAGATFERLQYRINVTSGDVVNATFYIGWPQLELGSFSTSPIRTTNAAATRAADVVKVTSPPVFGSAYSMFAQGVPQAPSAYANSQYLISIDDGTANNRIMLFRNGGTANFTAGATSGGVSQLSQFLGTWSQNVVGKMAEYARASDMGYCYNSNLTTQASGTLPVGVNGIVIGSRSATFTNSYNGYIQRFAIWPNTRISNSNLQTLTTLTYTPTFFTLGF